MLEDVKACTGKGNNLMAFAGPDVIFKVKDRKTVVKIHLTKGYCKNVEIDEIGAEEITCIKVAQFDSNRILIALSSGRVLMFNTDTSDKEILLDTEKKFKLDGKN